jgi:HD-GYP domain-containing protein (c-di-GMP phosphodiesterase class II)
MTDRRTPHILVVGDNATVQRYVSDSLARGTFRCTCISAALEARVVTRGTPVDAALVDVSSIGRDRGPGLTSWLLTELRHVPVVLIADSLPPELKTAVTGHPDLECLLTSSSGREVYDAVDRALRKRRDGGGDASDGGTSAPADCHEDMASRTSAIVRSGLECGIASTAALEAWLGILYQRDEWTAGHLCRVAQLSVLIGNELNLSERMVELLRRAALLHDVGRLAIPDRVLRKATPLSPNDRRLMRDYVNASHEIATAIPFLRPLADTLIAVRERYDGGGYPRRLHGDQIPLGARVIAVAEAFDALGSSTLREAGSVDRTNAELVRAGVCFDPHVVQAWLRCSDSGFFTAMRADWLGPQESW